MIIAQIIIIIPIIISVSVEILEHIFQEYKDVFETFEVDLFIGLRQRFMMPEFLDYLYFNWFRSSIVRSRGYNYCG